MDRLARPVYKTRLYLTNTLRGDPLAVTVVNIQHLSQHTMQTTTLMAILGFISIARSLFTGYSADFYTFPPWET